MKRAKSGFGLRAVIVESLGAMALLYLLFVMTWQIFRWPPEISITVAGAGVFVISLVSGLDYVLTWSRLAIQARGTT